MAGKTKFKVLVASADIGGTLARQMDTKNVAASKLEAILNDKDLNLVDIVSVSSNETDHEFQLIAVVKVAAEEK